MNDSTVDPQLAAALEHLGYTEDWIRGGLITSDQVIQEASLATRTREPTEHLRFASLSRWLEARSRLLDDELEMVLNLMRCDADQHMASSGIIRISQMLTEPQLDQWQDELSNFGPSVKARIDRRLLIRLVWRGPLSSEEFESVLQSRDKEVQQAMIDSGYLTQLQMKRLAEEGATKSIKSCARSLIRG